MTDEKSKVRERYLEQMVESASPERLILMLVQGAVNFIRRAAFELERERWDGVHNNLVKAQNIYLELANTIDFDAGEFAENLALVYQFLYNLLIEANLEKSAEKIAGALRLAEDIFDLWKDAVEKYHGETQGEAPVETIAASAPAPRAPQAIVYEQPGVKRTAALAADACEVPSRLNITG